MSLRPTRAIICPPFPQDNDMITVSQCRCARQSFARMHGSFSFIARERPNNQRYIYMSGSLQTPDEPQRSPASVAESCRHRLWSSPWCQACSRGPGPSALMSRCTSERCVLEGLPNLDARHPSASRKPSPSACKPLQQHDQNCERPTVSCVALTLGLMSRDIMYNSCFYACLA